MVPNLPTDNLYKFWALSGVALVILAFYLQVTSLESLQAMFREVTGKDAIVERMLSTTEKLVKPSMDEEAIEEVKDRLRRIEELDNESRSAHAEAKKLARDMTEQQSLLDLAFWTGMALSISGFFFWFVRLQAPQDELLRLRLASVRKEKDARLDDPAVGSSV